MLKPHLSVGSMQIGWHRIGPGFPAYIVAEISANHNQDFNRAVEIIKAAKASGADAVKLQTYTPDTLTIDCDSRFFQIEGTLWEGRKLFDLYREAFTPWEWQPRLKKIANDIGLELFSTPFDDTAVDFLEQMDVPAYKIASFEIVDIPLIQKIAATGKPVILSTGMASLGEIEEAVQAAREAGSAQIALLKCTSAYPAPPGTMNIRTIPHLAKTFGVPAGISDHTLGTSISVAAVAVGACIVERHLTLSRSTPGPDSAFSLEPPEFKTMVQEIRTIEDALGEVRYGASQEEADIKNFRRSLFAVKDIKTGELFTTDNIRSIRPGYGLPPKYLKEILGHRSSKEIRRGTPLNWNLVE